MDIHQQKRIWIQRQSQCSSKYYLNPTCQQKVKSGEWWINWKTHTLEPIGYQLCRKHRMEYDPILQEYYCKRCHTVNDTVMIHRSTPGIQIYPREYHRKDYLDKLLNKIYVVDESSMTTGLLLDYCRHLPNPFIWKDVFQMFNSSCNKDQWLSFGWWIDLKPDIDNMVLQFAMKYQDETIGGQKDSRCVNFFYLLYKGCQIYSKRAHTVPLKLTPLNLKKLDQWWKTICERDQIPFHPSHVECVYWEKNKICCSLIQALRWNGMKH